MFSLVAFVSIDCLVFFFSFSFFQTLVAKELHFEFSTPKKKTFALLTPIDMEKEIEAPNAPAPLKNPKSRLQGRKLSSLALFASMDEEQ